MTHEVLAGAIAIALAAAAAAQPQQAGDMTGNLGHPDYGVCRGTDPKCFHDWPRDKTVKYRVLLYTHTAGPRHAALGKPLEGGLNPPLGPDNVAQKEMLRLAAENGWTLDYTEDPKQMTSLNSYNAVVFLSTSRDNLDDNGKTALRQYMRAGGGFVGIHNAFGTLYNWPWYEGLLGGTNYYDHGPYRPGDVVVVDSKDSSTSQLPAKWKFRDEWYNLVPFPSQVRFLATVDEESLGEPVRQPRPVAGAAPPGFPPRLPSVVGRHPGHGTFHPVTWCQYYDGGRAWLTTLGHDAKAFQRNSDLPGADEFQKMVVGGIKSVMGEAPFCI